MTIGRSFFHRVSSVFVAGSLLLAAPLYGQGTSVQTAPADPAIAAALRDVSAAQVQATIEKLVSFKNRSTLSSMDTDLPPNTGVSAAADWIESQFKEISRECGGCLEVKRDDFVEPPQTGPSSRILKPTKITNIYAILRGTDPAQVARMVLVTGHYDSRNSDTLNTHDPAPGANDDASGVAVSLECARVLSKHKFPASIVFAAVAGEEQGLNGSAHLAKLAKSEGWQLEAVLNNDIVGGDTTPGDTLQDKAAVRVFSEGIPSNATPQQINLIRSEGAESDSSARELARVVADVGATYFSPSAERPASTPGRLRSQHLRLVPAFHPVLIFRRDRFLRGGDHISFSQEGFAAVRFTEWRENFNHQHQNVRVEDGVQYGDLLQFVDFNYVANVARLNAATLATLAAAPGEPRNVHIITAALDNNTELTWEPPAGMPANATYEIVWRDTTASNWTMSVSAGAVTTIKVPISKDNVIFGVRTVDEAGHRSPAVLPSPARNKAPSTVVK
ncbi:aminopeptidase [Edaphobacter acidisoli]|uniref:Aminopeptidase n=1 Tax=Edaphobacter acidisoli TaxID=2040573 RepID=A0A916RYF2_9BACT|nr:M28 family metallopeptidase [Edaphobacter acidisoli]GGA72890.1 aminopeptidase [Edaphobacter acidisoli]